MIKKAMEFARTIFAGDASGHDFDHTLRVYHMATRLAEEEGADLQTVQLAALLHDVDDRKLSPETCEGKLRAVNFLKENGMENEKIQEIVGIISRISFSAQLPPPDSIEGKCVRDADRLDAMGAIGIARTFAFGGSRGRRMHDPEGVDQNASIQHFYDKLLRLKDDMLTPTGKRLAAERDRYMRAFLEQFYAEWDGIR
jgi:uncharacterized protein